MTASAAAPSRHVQRREATRAELIRLGLERLPIKGYSATTIDDLVAGTEISRSTWYFHFGNKEEYFFELLKARAVGRGAWWEIGADERLTSLDQVLRAVFGHLRETDGHRHDWIVLTVDFWEHVKDDPAHADALVAWHRGNLAEIGRFIDAMRARGMVTSPADSATLAAAVFALAQGQSIHQECFGGGFDPIPPMSALLTAP